MSSVHFDRHLCYWQLLCYCYCGLFLHQCLFCRLAAKLNATFDFLPAFSCCISFTFPVKFPTVVWCCLSSSSVVDDFTLSSSSSRAWAEPNTQVEHIFRVYSIDVFGGQKAESVPSFTAFTCSSWFSAAFNLASMLLSWVAWTMQRTFSQMVCWELRSSNNLL